MGLLRVMMPPKLQLLALLAFAVAMFVLENQIQKLEESRGKLGKFRAGCCCWWWCCCCCRSSFIGSHRLPQGQLNSCTSNSVCGQFVLRCATHMASITSQTIADTHAVIRCGRGSCPAELHLASVKTSVPSKYNISGRKGDAGLHSSWSRGCSLIIDSFGNLPQKEAIDQLLCQKAIDHTKAPV